MPFGFPNDTDGNAHFGTGIIGEEIVDDFAVGIVVDFGHCVCSVVCCALFLSIYIEVPLQEVNSYFSARHEKSC